MASSIQLLRSNNAKERPFPGNLLDGQPAINTSPQEPGLFFKANDGTIIKIGPAAITSDGNPPNAGAVGQSGNTIGELWLDKSLSVPVLKVYDGVQWVDAGSGSGGGGSPSIVTLQRWAKTAVGGETSLSGPDNTAQILSYTPELEEVFLNGVLLTRDVDYFASSGASITSLSPLTAGDEVTVLGWTPFNVLESIDSSKVNFVQTGAGAVQRTVDSKLKDVVSVKDFGAKGDGVTDDTAAIQAAINANSGKSVFFPPGKYTVSGTLGSSALTCPALGISLLGASQNNAILSTEDSIAFFSAVDVDNVEIAGLQFTNNATSRTAWQRGILLRGVRNASVHDCTFHKIGDGCINAGMKGQGGSEKVPDGTRMSERVQICNNQILDCRGTVMILTKFIGAKELIIAHNVIKDSGSVGISLESETGVPGQEMKTAAIVGNIVDGCSYTYTGGISNVSWGISISEYSEQITVTANTVSNIIGNTISAGISVDTSPSQSDLVVDQIAVSSNVISGVLADTGRGHGIICFVGDSNAKNITIFGNSIKACFNGITLETAAGAKTLGTIKNICINGNVIASCLDIGLFHTNIGASGELPVENATISANVLVDNANHGASLRLTRSSIVGNIFRGNGGTGLIMQAGASLNNVSNNFVSSSGRNGITINGDLTTLIGNTCLNNGTDGTTSFGIEIVSGSNCIVALNNCSDTQGSPTQDFGIRAPNGTTVRNNEYIGNASGGNWNGISNHNTGTYDAGLNRTA
jgi:hypothetical protein